MNQLGKNPFYYMHFILERTSISSWVFLLLLFFAFGFVSGQDGDGVVMTQSDFQALKAIEQDLIDPRRVLKSWNGSINGSCSGEWVGITCLKGEVVSISLPWKGLGGKISDKIGQLQSLRRLSLHDNYLTGPIPDSLGLLPYLRAVYLFNNRLSGSIPLSIAQSSGLQTLHLSNNKLSGTIPPTLSNSTRIYRLNLSFNSLSGSIPGSLTQSPSLTFLSLQYNNLSGSVPDSWGGQGGKVYQLQVLTLDHNHLNGSIPETIGNISGITQLDFSYNNFTGLIPISLSNLHNLTYFNVSYNNLSGFVPTLLSEKFNSSSFVGNLQLCGYSSSSPCPSSPPPQVSPSPSPEGLQHSHRKLSTKDIILIVAGALLLVLLLLCFLLLCCLIRKRAKKTKNGKNAGRVEKAVPASGGEVESGGEVGGKLVHFDGPFVFAADDLLCATAEIMGKSTYGTIYKATLEDGNQVAVKRLREKVAKGQKEFETEVVAIGKIRHLNVLALRAYYVGPKGEKLLVFDYMPNGSLASFLHARGPETVVNWPTRMNIAMGITRGLCYLHNEENIIHGNLTSSNVLLDEQTNPKISDVGLSRLMTSSANANVIATAGTQGYRAPELSKLKNANTKSDIYSLGVIILELLTGKSPGEATTDGVDLPQWVASIVKEEWTNEVFDVELMRDDAFNSGDELLNTLKLALHCVDPTPSARPEAQQVLQQLEEIKPEMAAVSVDEGDKAAGGD
ncbi:hypothetical protein RHMOL_Rhmol04G0170800 [Rhododendron molle]|uniref:Uncharacterized protein n=1 Tax=Rhododendron molle TaxID=49168 RepID=A0ACC0P3U8_RHOML|nr:hypothetical protein RHMOL_Rhmol04G0170800 [Rhododendron molle]